MSTWARHPFRPWKVRDGNSEHSRFELHLDWSRPILQFTPAQSLIWQKKVNYFASLCVVVVVRKYAQKQNFSTLFSSLTILGMVYDVFMRGLMLTEKTQQRGQAEESHNCQAVINNWMKVWAEPLRNGVRRGWERREGVLMTNCQKTAGDAMGRWLKTFTQPPSSTCRK